MSAGWLKMMTMMMKVNRIVCPPESFPNRVEYRPMCKCVHLGAFAALTLIQFIREGTSKMLHGLWDLNTKVPTLSPISFSACLLNLSWQQ